MNPVINESYQNQQSALGICILARVPFLLWGDPGIGKTETLKSFAMQWNLNLETVILSQREPSDLLGIPFVYNGEMKMSVPDIADSILKSNAKGQGTFLFFDEISTASPSSQAASLRVFAERILGKDIKLPDNVILGGAANPPNIAAGGFSLAPPTANRFIHLDWKMPKDVLVSGLAGNWPKTPIPVMPKNPEIALRNAKALIGAFLSARGSQEYVSGNPDVIESANFKASDYAFASPRMWVDYVAPVLAICLSGKIDGKPINRSVLRILLNGSVGTSISNEFLAFINSLDLPNPKPVLDGESRWSPRKEMRSDQLHAVCSSFLVEYQSNPRPDRWVILGNVLSEVAQFAPDIALPTARAWLQLRPEGVLPSDKAVATLEPFIRKLSALN